LWLWSYLAPFSRYGDLLAKNCPFLLTLSHSAPSLPMFPSEFRAEVNSQETRIMGLSSSEDRMIVAGVVLAWYQTVTDTRSDERSDRIYHSKLCWSAVIITIRETRNVASVLYEQISAYILYTLSMRIQSESPWYSLVLILLSKNCNFMPLSNFVNTRRRYHAVSANIGRHSVHSAVCGDLAVPARRTACYGSRSFAVVGPSTWNSLSASLHDYSLTLTRSFVAKWRLFSSAETRVIDLHFCRSKMA